MTDEMKNAIRKITDDLIAMSDEDFDKLIEEHKNGEYAAIFKKLRESDENKTNTKH